MKLSRFVLIIIIIVFSPFTSHADFGDCSDNWEITGYYVPSEADFFGSKKEINLAEGGTRMLKQDFLDTVSIEGSGKSEAGEIIEWYWDAWHVNDKPEDYFGEELIIGTAAVDPEVIPFQRRFMIPSLQAPYNGIIYTASDIGPSIKGKHIDVFMGFGKHALDEAWKFPDYNTVCLETGNNTAKAESEGAGANSEALARVLSGRILLETEKNGEAWYVHPADNKRYYLGRPDDAFAIMRRLGLGAKHEFIMKYTVYPEHVWGRILIDVDDLGKAYYINPIDKKAYYLGRPSDAFAVMSWLGLGISNNDIAKIGIGGL